MENYYNYYDQPWTRRRQVNLQYDHERLKMAAVQMACVRRRPRRRWRYQSTSRKTQKHVTVSRINTASKTVS